MLEVLGDKDEELLQKKKRLTKHGNKKEKKTTKN